VTSGAVLAVEDLVVDYKVGRGSLRAVDGVSLTLGAGEILGVVGESGSGKSTLGRAVTGFLRPTSGRVLVAGPDGGPLAPRRATRGYRDVQMVFQESAAALNPRLPVWKLVGEALRPDTSLFRQGGSLKDRVRERLGRVGLPESYVTKRAVELSGGEKQRVAVARALAADPLVVVCDEAVSALDVSVRAVILNLVARLRAETGISLLFISHDIAVVGHLADRVLVMHHGRAVELGPTREVIDEPRDDYTRALIAAVPKLERE
jgi:ABC-type glutathione transport system ATPase component